MKCIEISGFGEPEVLTLVERPVPMADILDVGEVLIKVTASGVNRPDVVQRQGKYPAPAGASDLAGLEVAGTIEAGDESELREAGFAIGDRVCALLSGGGYAQYCIAHISHCLPVPAGLTDVQAAALPETFFTVWSNLFDLAKLKAGQSVLIQGGSSGIGTTAIQLAKAFGATVYATAGSDEKCKACIELGADYVINYRKKDFAEEIKSLTNKRGVNIILDMVAGEYVSREIESLSVDGKLIIIAIQGGIKSNFNAGLLLVKRLSIMGNTLRSQNIEFKSKIAKQLKEKVWALIEQGKIAPVIHSVFPAVIPVDNCANGAVAAHKLMESNKHIGKIVLTWSE